MIYLKSKSDEAVDEPIKNEYNVSKKRGVNITNIYADESDIIRVRVPQYIRDCVSCIAKNKNKKFTQGIVAYEWIMMYNSNLNDMLAEFEDEIDTKLKNEDINPKLINKIEWSDKLYAKKQKDKRMNVYIPSRVKNQMDINQYKDLVIKSVENGFNSLYRDRKERIDVKKALFNYIKNDVNPANKKAKMIINDDNEIDIPSDLVLNIDDEIKEWDDFKNKIGKTTKWDIREKMIVSVCNNNSLINHYTIKSVIQDKCDIADEKYLTRKLNKIGYKHNLDYIVDVDNINYNHQINTTKNNLADDYKANNYRLDTTILGFFNSQRTYAELHIKYISDLFDDEYDLQKYVDISPILQFNKNKTKITVTKELRDKLGLKTQYVSK